MLSVELGTVAAVVLPGSGSRSQEGTENHSDRSDRFAVGADVVDATRSI